MYTSLYMLQLTLQCCMNKDCSTFLQPVFHFSTVQQVAGGGGGVLLVQVFCAIGFTIAIIVFSAGRQGSHVHVHVTGLGPKDPGEGTLG